MTTHPCPMPGCVDEHGAPMQVTTPVCDTHRLRIARTIAGIARLYVELNLSLTPDSSSGLAEQVTVSRTPPLPMSVTRRALQEELVTTTLDLEDWYREARDFTRRPNRGREGPTVAASALFLRQHLDQILGYDLAIQGVINLDLTVRNARRALGLTKLVHRLPEPCPSCETKALERDNGADRVECRYCGRVFTELEYDRLVAILAGERKAS